MQVVSSDAHLAHVPGVELAHGHFLDNYERPERGEVIRRALEADPAFTFTAPTEHGSGPITAVHDAGLVAYLATAWQETTGGDADTLVIPDTFLIPALREGMGDARLPTAASGAMGAWCFDSSTPLSEGTYGAALAAVDIALTATDLVLGGQARAYGLCRPPGHHAPRAAYGGYCFFNNAAIAAQHARHAGAAKVVVLDVDYHHGNGTQQIFYERADVMYVSLHGDPDRAYPHFVGFSDEVGTGAGRGTNVNLPLPAHADDDAVLAALDQAIDAIAAFGPELLIVSLGVDTYELDPIGDLAVTTDGFREQGRRCSGLGLPTVVLQEGGYHIDHLGRNVHAFLSGIAS